MLTKVTVGLATTLIIATPVMTAQNLIGGGITTKSIPFSQTFP